MTVLQALGETVDRAAEIVWVDERLHRRAWAKAASDSSKGPSLVDWTGFLVMEDRGIKTALAIDIAFGGRGIGWCLTPTPSSGLPLLPSCAGANWPRSDGARRPALLQDALDPVLLDLSRPRS